MFFSSICVVSMHVVVFVVACFCEFGVTHLPFHLLQDFVDRRLMWILTCEMPCGFVHMGVCSPSLVSLWK